MGFIIGLLTLFMVLDCMVLIFLVLIQLPKKEAGAGLAFGGAATDALFGAGSGNVLTKITKYAATIFFVLADGALDDAKPSLSAAARARSSRSSSSPSRRGTARLRPLVATAAPAGGATDSAHFFN